jgi:hypothetical protein
MFNLTCPALPSRTSVKVWVWNPVFVALTLYVPGNKLGKLYNPALLLITLFSTPVAVFAAVTTTPVTIPPELSVTIPLRLAKLDWPNAWPDKTRINGNAIKAKALFMASSSQFKMVNTGTAAGSGGSMDPSAKFRKTGKGIVCNACGDLSCANDIHVFLNRLAARPFKKFRPALLQWPVHRSILK